MIEVGKANPLFELSGCFSCKAKKNLFVIRASREEDDGSMGDSIICLCPACVTLLAAELNKVVDSLYDDPQILASAKYFAEKIVEADFEKKEESRHAE